MPTAHAKMGHWNAELLKNTGLKKKRGKDVLDDRQHVGYDAY